jgi:hypothetical protein
MLKSNAQILHAPSPARERYGLKDPLFSEEALQRADDVLQEMSAELAEWLDMEVARLQEARLSAQDADWGPDGLEHLACVAHDVKGVGATYGYPLVTEIAASLCRVLECAEGRAATQRDAGLVCAHVDAVRAVVRQGVTSRTAPIGKALISALETRVAALGLPQM